MRKSKECRMLGLIWKGTKINGKEGKHRIENIEENPLNVAHWTDEHWATLMQSREKMKLTIPRMKRDISINHTDISVIVFVLLFVCFLAVLLLMGS